MAGHRYAMWMETPENTCSELLGLTGNYDRAAEQLREFSRTNRARTFRLDDEQGKRPTLRFRGGLSTAVTA